MTTKWTIEENIFDTPSGNVRGIIVGLLGEGKKSRPVAHAMLLTDEEPNLFVGRINRPTLEEVQSFSDLLTEFAARVAQRNGSDETR